MPRPKEGSRRKKTYPSTTFDVYNYSHNEDSVPGLAGREIRKSRHTTGTPTRRKAGGPQATSSAAAAAGRAPGSAWQAAATVTP
jgi:hypothetical protein